MSLPTAAGTSGLACSSTSPIRRRRRPCSGRRLRFRFSSRRSPSSGWRTRTARWRWRAPRRRPERSCASRRFATSSWDEIAATGVARWFQFYVPRDPGLAAEIAGNAREHGFGALVLTVDTPVLGRRERDLRTGSSFLTTLGLESVAPTRPTPLTASGGDVRVLDLAGCRAVRVARRRCRSCSRAWSPRRTRGSPASTAPPRWSSRTTAARQLDGVAATIDSLAEVVEAVDGRIEVLLDGGIRRGTDVVKALALGARAVLAGRAPLWGLAVGRRSGAPPTSSSCCGPRSRSRSSSPAAGRPPR